MPSSRVAAQRGGERRRGVDHQQVAGTELVGKVEEARVDELAPGLSDHQPDLVADRWGRGRFEPRGEVEVQRGHAGTSSRAW